jgi:hypothetical protein
MEGTSQDRPENQLVRQYLIPTGCQYGIYLVYWAKPQR